MAHNHRTGGSSQDRRRARRAEDRTALTAATGELGGKPSPGTKPDKRLKENKPGRDTSLPDEQREMAASPERDALEQARAALAPRSSVVVHLQFGEKAAEAAAAALLEHVTLSTDDADGPTADEVGERIRLRLQEFVVELADIAQLPDAHQPGETIPASHPSPRQPDADPNARRDGATEMRWTATLCPEGVLTDDGRAFAPDAISWRELPLTLMAMVETSAEGGHDGAQVCGRIDQVWRAGNLIMASGVFSTDEYGQQIAAWVSDGTLRGVSVDIAANHVEVGPRSQWFDADGNWAPSEPSDGAAERSLVDLLLGGDGEEDDPTIFVVTDGTVGMATVCPFQAFADARIELAASLVAGAMPGLWTATGQAGWTTVERPLPEGADAEPPEPTEGLTAAAAGLAPVRPDADWFAPPNLDALTPLTIDDDGRVYGHAAAWDTCHIGIPGTCTTAPHSNTNYAYYLLKEVECAGGERLACGTITLGTGHANRGLARIPAAAHYDDTGSAVADVAVGEDEHGIWVAGALRPDISAERVRELRGAVLSGDWRNVSGNLELVALLAVNVPGFPVPRAQAELVASADGVLERLTLVAAGVTIGARADALTSAQQEKLAALLVRVRGDAAAALDASAEQRLAALLARAEAA